MASYATPAELIARKRWSNVEQVANDDGVAEQEEDLETNVSVLQALEDASGEVDAALRAGKRYTPAQLEGLTGNAAAHLKRIVCDLAYANLVCRADPGADASIALRDQATLWIEKLQKGIDVFGIDSHIDAGLTKSETPSVESFVEANSITTVVPRFFPDISRRLPRSSS